MHGRIPPATVCLVQPILEMDGLTQWIGSCLRYLVMVRGMQPVSWTMTGSLVDPLMTVVGMPRWGLQ